MQEDQTLTGRLAATFTPFAHDGSIHPEVIPDMVEMLVSEGLAGLYVNGTTGEGPSLSNDERKELAQAFVAAANGRIPVIIQVGHNSVEEARDLAQHAQAIGADGISATPPGYFRADGTETLVLTMDRIASAAPDTSFYYYHIPAFGGVSLDMAAFAESASHRIENFGGIKFSSPQLHEFDRCRRELRAPQQIFFGVDEMLLAALAMGASAAVGSTYNFAPRLYTDIVNAFNDGDLETAGKLQSTAVDMIQIITDSCGRAGLKAAMNLTGIPCGGHRLPVVDATDVQVTEMHARLRSEDLLKWFCGN